MDVLIISNFCMDFSKDDNDRFLYIAKQIYKEHDVEIVTSDFFHTKKVKRNTTEYTWPFKITFLHETGYKKNVCLKRFVSHYIWGKNVKKYLKKRKKPDVVYCAVPSLSAALHAARYCKKKNVKLIIDVQDLWPEAFKMIFNIPVISDLIYLPFTIIANMIYQSADEVVAVSQSYVNRVKKHNKKNQLGHSVFIGTELQNFDKYSHKQPKIIKDKSEIWLAYCGTLGSSYDIKCVIDALELLMQSGIKPPVLIVMGDGPKKYEFQEYANTKKVLSKFLGRLSYEEMCALLVECDMTINPIVGLSVASIINKHADYAASGLPVINTQNSQEYIDLVEEYKMGINIGSGDVRALAKAIEQLCNDKDLRLSMGKGARKCAMDLFDRANTYKIIERCIISN